MNDNQLILTQKKRSTGAFFLCPTKSVIDHVIQGKYLFINI